MKKISSVMRGEMRELKPRVAKLYAETIPQISPVWSNRPTLPMLIAFTLDIYDGIEKACELGGRTIDFNIIKEMTTEQFSKTIGLNITDVGDRYRTSFHCADALLDRLDTFTRERVQPALAGSGRVNRNFSVMLLFRLALLSAHAPHSLPTLPRKIPTTTGSAEIEADRSDLF